MEAKPKVWGAVMNRAVPSCFELDHFVFGTENRIKRPRTAKIFFSFSAPVISHCKIWIIFLNDLFGQHYTQSRPFSFLRLLKIFCGLLTQEPRNLMETPKDFLVILNVIAAILFKFLL